jgi:hypothetical protein
MARSRRSLQGGWGGEEEEMSGSEGEAQLRQRGKQVPPDSSLGRGWLSAGLRRSEEEGETQKQPTWL